MLCVCSHLAPLPLVQSTTGSYGFSPSTAQVTVTGDSATVPAITLDTFSVSGIVRGAQRSDGSPGSPIADVQVREDPLPLFAPRTHSHARSVFPLAPALAHLRLQRLLRHAICSNRVTAVATLSWYAQVSVNGVVKATSGPDGRYVIPGVKAGSVTVEAASATVKFEPLRNILVSG